MAARKQEVMKEKRSLTGPNKIPKIAKSLMSPKPILCVIRAIKVRGKLKTKKPKIHSNIGLGSIMIKERIKNRQQ